MNPKSCFAAGVASIALAGLVTGCASPQAKAANAQVRAANAQTEAARAELKIKEQRLKMVDDYKKCIADAGNDSMKADNCDRILKAIEVLK